VASVEPARIATISAFLELVTGVTGATEVVARSAARTPCLSRTGARMMEVARRGARKGVRRCARHSDLHPGDALDGHPRIVSV